ncbi:T6SS phospholipase effector Tle1-like catalytic domain-containing protein [Flavobacterium aquidurense]|uniref:Rhs element Vgr protein n=1 Tax=Flavobacterium aquidurense TaxID=362413 RepID=A0A0Q0VZV6_9FLAO|nr:DUF2235 domain-containing protein [Flavobacterium aquidurense]KQB37455.1 Rhs element Vgr protein [Flavobacterium aquidurense]
MGKTFVYNTGAGKDEEKQDELPLTFGIFIDGTLNNKENTDMRNKHSRGIDKNGKVDYSKGNGELETEDSKEYKKIKNKGRIEDLLSKKNKTPAEQAEFRAIPERDKYLVASYRVPLNEFGLDRMGTDNSYSNDYTNVARMWQCCEQKKYAIYVPGMGTDNLMRDSQDGFAFGSGQTGIRARVRNACEQIADKISEAIKTNPKKEIKVTKITIDVFGFSRGAATARNLVYEVNLDSGYANAVQKEIPNGIEYKQSASKKGGPIAVRKFRKAFVDVDNYEIDNTYLVNDQLPKMGHLGYSLLQKTDLEFKDLKNIEIIVRFVGIYDTVSSYFEQNDVQDHYDDYGNLKDEGGKLIKEAWSTHFNDDIGELHLNNLYCQKVVHFTAKDEHRQNFALTRINQIPGKYIEKNFPGVHCDIGGAYMTEKEVIDEIGTQMKDRNYVSVLPASISYDRMGLDALRGDLIRQYWYREEQIEINIQWSLPPYSKLTGTRGKKIEGTDDQYEGVKKEYSYVPLHFMETYAKSTEMKEYFVEESGLKFPLDDFLKHVESYLTPYALDETNEVKEWDFICDEEIEEKRLERIEKQKLEAEIESFEQRLKDHTYEMEGLKKVTDNLRVEQYKPQLDFGTLKIPQETAVKEPEIRTIDLPEVKVIGYNSQTMLRKLRNEYLHWSSTRDWFGMQPNTNRKRQIH